MTRRDAAGRLAALAMAAKPAPPVILLRSGWQSVNIGDITHTPGALAMIERALPDARVILWPAEIERGVEPMLSRRFPKLRIVKGQVDPATGKPDSAELRVAFAEAAICIHGSGPSVVGPAQMAGWRAITGGKPYGFLGIGFTIAGEVAGVKADPALVDLLGHSKFVFTRETTSLRNLGAAGISGNGPETGFCPDATFSFDIRDDARGDAYRKQEGLEPGKFLVVVPRLRYTPYHLIRKTPPYGPEEVERRTRINNQWAEQDHAKFREAIIAYVRKSGGSCKVLLCPEMTYELDVLEPLLYAPLPDDVRKHVAVRKTYWLPDEAASIYRHAALVLSFECHSPIIAASAGAPCMYVRQREDGIKGQMYPDLGLGGWYVEDVEKVTGAALASRVLEITGKPKASAAQVRAAVTLARRKQNDAMAYVRKLSSAWGREPAQ